MIITLPELLEVDLPTIIILIVVWLINFFKLDDLEHKVDELRKK